MCRRLRWSCSNEQFYRLYQANRDVRLERTADGKLIVMPPTGGETGDRNAEIIFQLRGWIEALPRPKVRGIQRSNRRCSPRLSYSS
ncbi:MAG: hypothetical protein BRC54_13385 [Cyanobacteria bacterium SW_7_48_12]|nr:MAG: hypothetical protein BRC54_13385 [Cyanobacteria bacterium SW_7_48_12]